MNQEESWSLTPREFQERHRVREAYLALWRAETRNAPHIVRKDKRLWTDEDFLNTDPNRAILEQRKAVKAKFEELQFELNIAKAELPDWAKPEYHRYQVKQ